MPAEKTASSVVQPTEFPRLRAGDVFDFVTPTKQGTTVERGRLIYAFNHRRPIPQENGVIDEHSKYEIVAHRCGYVPLVDRFREWSGESLRIWEVHLGVGAFLIRRITG